MKALTKDGKYFDIPFKEEKKDGYYSVSVSADLDFSNIETVEMDVMGVVAETSDEGYMVLPKALNCSSDYALCYFNKHSEDFEKEFTLCSMPIFGVKTDKRTYLAVIGGMSYDFKLKIELKNGKYKVYPIYEIYGEQPYEDLKLEIFELTGSDANYSGMARRYRKYRMDKGEIVPISERMKNCKTLEYTKDSVLIRVRCGWKPAPPAVLHQTLENEPEMHVACDFDRVGDILDELKAQGVEKAEICLIGWNVKGHDGRWPQAFPVCEELGGEEKLRALIKKAQSMGYQIVCHTNSTDQYEIADIYDENNTALKRDGEPMVCSQGWSGGTMYSLCPIVGAKQAEEILPKVAELGFRGTHYIDVFGVVTLRRCWHKEHYVDSKKSIECMAKISELSKRLFGGLSTEGAADFLVPYIDYALYVCPNMNVGDLCDKAIPFWQLVYHGITLSNPYSATMNCTFKEKSTLLKVIEFGGRPSYYFYSAFMGNGENWMGNTDALCDNDEQLKTSVSKIKEGYDIYTEMSDINTAFMENHEEVAENVYEVTYSNGTVVRVDYNNESYEIFHK